MSKIQTRSPLEEISEDINISVNKGENVDCDVLHIEQMSHFWSIEKVIAFIREITKSEMIIEGIKYVTLVKTQTPVGGLINSGFLIKFENAHICKLAHAEWSALSESKNIKVSYDLENLFEKKKHFKKPFKRVKPILGQEYPAAKKQKPSKTHFAPFTNEVDNEETYGFSKEFLSGLGIKLPLRTRLYVANLHPDVDEAKIREVFCLAGHIVRVVVIKQDSYSPVRTFAKVEYDHPVEAVQAISMFSKQKLFSLPLAINMDTKPCHDIPKGLSGIGPGLGPNGEPLKGIRNRFELEPLKKLLKRDYSDPKVLSSTNMGIPNSSQFVHTDMPILAPMANNSMSVQTPIFAQIPMAPAPVQAQIPLQAPNQESLNPLATASSMMNPFNMPVFQNMQILQNLNQQDTATFQQAVTMLFQHMNTNVTGQTSEPSGNVTYEWQTQTNNEMEQDITQPNVSATEKKIKIEKTQDSYDSRSERKGSSKSDDRSSRDSRRSRDNDKYKDKNKDKSDDKYNDKSDMLIFKNLPRSVTLQALKNKMREVGELKFAEMTGNGKALVRFCHSRDAKRCIKLYDRSKVDGLIIDVRYF